MNKESLIYNLWYRQPDWYSWSKAFLLSLFLHLGILLVALIFSITSPKTVSLSTVYTVELVSGLESLKPATVSKTKAQSVTSKRRKIKTVSSGSYKSVPIWRVKTKTNPQVKIPLEKAELSSLPAKKLASDSAVGKELERIARSVARKNVAESKLNSSSGVHKKKKKIVSGVSSKTSGKSKSGISGTASSGEVLSLARSAYYTEIWDRIRREWALAGELVKRQGNLTATLVIRIRRDGKILSAKFERRSGDKAFDDSVWRAIWKADPLPPFPQIYSADVDELGIRFRLAELLK